MDIAFSTTMALTVNFCFHICFILDVNFQEQLLGIESIFGAALSAGRPVVGRLLIAEKLSSLARHESRGTDLPL